MITTAAHHPWPGDTPVTELQKAGLHTPCIARLKLFTLDNRLILRRLGQLGVADRSRFDAALQSYLV